MFDQSGHLSVGRILDSLSVAATLDAAARCARYVKLRRSGVDASSQESESVASLRVDDSTRALKDVALNLRLHRVLDGTDDAEEVESIRRFEVLLLLRKAAEGLRSLHQGLLSLYPSVDETVVEDTRRLQVLFSGLLESGEVDASLIDLLEALLFRVREGRG